MVKLAKFTRDEQDAVDKILDRAATLAAKVSPMPLDRLSLSMDLACVHARTPLLLNELAAADDFQIAHDVFGICRQIDRATGELRDHFSPRFSAPRPEPATRQRPNAEAAIGEKP